MSKDIWEFMNNIDEQVRTFFVDKRMDQNDIFTKDKPHGTPMSEEMMTDMIEYVNGMVQEFYLFLIDDDKTQNKDW